MNICNSTCGDNIIKSNNYCIVDGKRFDVLKIILALFIVAIHTTPIDFSLRPLFRLAVPLFFILSSYLFFSKQSRLISDIDKTIALKKFVSRYLKLYLFWFVVLLPITIVVRKWYIAPGFNTILSVLQCFFFDSTFRASWFLMAALINVVFVWAISKRIHDKWLLLLGIILYSFCCLTSNYYSLIQNEGILNAYSTYQSIFTSPYNSFPVALLFVVYGKILAEKSVSIPQQLVFLLTIISLILLYVEYYVICHFNVDVIQDDSFIFLIPSSLFCFMYIGQSGWTLKAETLKIRKASTVIYCCHASFTSIVSYILEKCDIKSLILYYVSLFLITLLVCVMTFVVIDKLEKKPHLGFFKYAH